VLGMGLAAATGERVFGYFDTEPGDVLYFALEDSPQRLQERLDTLAKGWELPDNFRFVHRCPPMPEFEEALERMVQDYPETRLVVVDVLAKVQQPRRGNRNSYQEDSAALTPLQHFALDHGMGVVGVTHSNQREVTTDRFHRVTGTQTGLDHRVGHPLAFRPSPGRAVVDGEALVVSRRTPGSRQTWTEVSARKIALPPWSRLPV
jgi:RecA-family ATPase